MPEKNENAHRWGGPGSSEQNADQPRPEPEEPRPDGAPTNPPVSQVSGGGGERDNKHSHDDQKRSSKHPNS